MIRALALAACLLTVCITASSAFIRHWQDGLGCDGWPECYRAARPASQAVSTPLSPAAIGTAGAPAVEAAASATPRPVRIARGLHRVSATIVGVLVLFVVVFGWSTMRGGERVAAAVALVDTVFLSWLGRYTPHDLPLVTLGNLLGGLLLAGALAWIAAARASRRAGGQGDVVTAQAAGARRLAFVALAVLALLAWSGTMIGARQAIDACSTPLCVAGARLDAGALDPTRAAVELDAAAAQGLHVAHRVAGLAAAAVIALLAFRLRAARPAAAAWMALLVLAQLLLGAGTALGAQPLVTATRHNAIAALLAVALAGAAARARSRSVG